MTTELVKAHLFLFEYLPKTAPILRKRGHKKKNKAYNSALASTLLITMALMACATAVLLSAKTRALRAQSCGSGCVIMHRRRRRRLPCRRGATPHTRFITRSNAYVSQMPFLTKLTASAASIPRTRFTNRGAFASNEVIRMRRHGRSLTRSDVA